MHNHREIHRRTISVYEENANAWDQQRPTVFFEKMWVDRFIGCLPPGSSVLDVGCGAGVPITRYLMQQGFQLTGIDASPRMIEIARSRLDCDLVVMDMRSLNLDSSYDGILSWDAFFHLSPGEQRSTMRLFCQHLNPGGSLLLTIGDVAGEVLGTVNGEQVYHSSLDPSEYEEFLEGAGFSDVAITLNDEACGDHSVLLASNYRGPNF